jgi:hypothetical protein
MTDLTSQFAADAALEPADPAIDAECLSVYVQDLLKTEARIATLNANLKEAEAESRRLREQVLPELMDRLRLKKVEADDGSKIVVGTVVRASLPKDPDDGPPSELRQEGLSWLKIRHAGAVKHVLTADLGKGAGNQAPEIAELIQIRLPSAIVTHGETIHPMTLASIVRQELEAGGSPPLEALGAYVTRAVKVTKPKT